MWKSAEDSAPEALWPLRVQGFNCNLQGTVFNCTTQRFVLTKDPTGLSYFCPRPLFPTSYFTLCIYFYLWNVPPCPPWPDVAWLHSAQVLLSQLQSKQNCLGPWTKKTSWKTKVRKSPTCPCPAVNSSLLQKKPHTTSLMQTQGIGLTTQTGKHQERGTGAL